MRFKGVSTWWAGVAAMGVVLITFLNAPSVTASNTVGWQVRIGDQQSISVNANDIGTALFQGEFVVETRLDASGNLTPQSVCVGFPEVETVRNIYHNDDYSIQLLLDTSTCRIVVDDLRGTNVPVSMSNAASESHEEHWGRAIVKALELGGLGRGFALTQSKVMLDYSSSLRVYDSSHICEVQSPAALAGISWHNDDCVASPVTRHGSYIKTKTTGDFHATRLGGNVWQESIHSSSAEIKGYSTKYVITCKWSPPSIKDLRWGPFRVALECRPDES